MTTRSFQKPQHASAVAHSAAGADVRVGRTGAAATSGDQRVLLASNSRKVGGGAVSLFTLATGLRETGRSVVVAHPEPGLVFDKFADAGLANEVVPERQPSLLRPWDGLLGTRSWTRLIDRHGIDLVHANAPSMARTVATAAHRRGLPFVCHVRFPVEDAFADWAFRRLPSPDVFVFCSAALRDENAPRLARRSPRAQMAVVHNAVCIETFRPVEAATAPSAIAPSAAAVPAASGTGPRPKVGVLAHLAAVKGHEDFLRMAAEITARGLDADYEILGGEAEAGLERRLRSLAAELGIDDRVHFRGFVSDVPDRLRALDVLVCPSHVEPFGRCLIEAMACGLPVVATRVGGIPEVVVEGETGFLVPPRDPGALAEALAPLLLDAGARGSLGRAGRERVLARFSRSAHTDNVLDVYREVLQRGARP